MALRGWKKYEHVGPECFDIPNQIDTDRIG